MFLGGGEGYVIIRVTLEILQKARRVPRLFNPDPSPNNPPSTLHAFKHTHHASAQPQRLMLHETASQDTSFADILRVLCRNAKQMEG